MTAAAETRPFDLPGVPAQGSRAAYCGSCGKKLPPQRIGRPKQYCGGSCKQRAYEERKEVERAGIPGIPVGAVVLSAEQVATFGDRIFQVQCAVEDIVTATEEGSTVAEIGRLAHELLSQVRGMELRR